MYVDWFVAFDRDLAGDHGFHEVTSPHRVTSRRDCRSVRGERGKGFDSEATRAGNGWKSLEEVGDWCAVDDREPSRAVGMLANHSRRHDQFGIIVCERQGAEGDRAGTTGAFVVVFDRGEKRDGLVGRHASRDITTGYADSVAHEQETVTASYVVQIEIVVDSTCRRFHVRSGWR